MQPSGKVINVFDTDDQKPRELALYPAGRTVPEGVDS